MKGLKLNDAVLNTIKEGLLIGLTRCELADVLDVNHTTIYAWWHKARDHENYPQQIYRKLNDIIDHYETRKKKDLCRGVMISMNNKTLRELEYIRDQEEPDATRSATLRNIIHEEHSIIFGLESNCNSSNKSRFL